MWELLQDTEFVVLSLILHPAAVLRLFLLAQREEDAVF